MPGESPGALLHPVPCSRGKGYVPYPCRGRQSARKQAGARAKAQHHLPVLLRAGAACTLPPPGPGQAVPPHHAAHGHRWPNR